MSERAFWSAARSRRFSIALLLSLLIAWFIALRLYKDTESAVWIGDFPTFYSGAWLVLNARALELYNAQSLQTLQQIVWPFLDGYFPYAYPPFVALFMAPLALLPAFWAQQLWTILSFALVLLSFRLVSTALPFYRQAPLERFAAFVSFAPCLHALVAGQNLALSIFFYALFIRGFLGQGRGSDLILALSVVAWSFKPHFALLAWVLLLISKRYRALSYTLVLALLLYLLTSGFFGFAWPLWWLNALSTYAGPDFLSNQYQMVSIYSAARAMTDGFNFVGSFFQLGAAGLSLVLLLWYALDSRRAILDGALIRPLIILGPLLVLISPHTLYYDLGIGLFPLLGIFEFKNDRQVWLAILIWIAAALLVLFKEHLNVTPLILAAIVQFWLSTRLKPHRE